MINTDELMQEIISSDDPTILQEQKFKNAATFPEYLSKLMLRENVTPSRLREGMRLERSYAYQLFNGVRNPTKRHIICIGILLNLSLDEIQRMLKIAGRGELYPRNHFDATVIYAIANKMSLDDTNDLLQNGGEKPLI